MPSRIARCCLDTMFIHWSEYVAQHFGISRLSSLHVVSPTLNARTQSIVSGTSTWDVLVSLQHRQAHGACVAVPVALGLLENQQVSTALAGGFLSAVASILRCDCARCDTTCGGAMLTSSQARSAALGLVR